MQYDALSYHPFPGMEVLSDDRNIHSWDCTICFMRDNWHQAAQKDMILLLNTDLQNRLQKYFRAWQLVLNPRKWKQTAWRVSKLFKNKHLSERTSTELVQDRRREEITFWNPNLFHVRKVRVLPKREVFHFVIQASLEDVYVLCIHQLDSWQWISLHPTCLCKDLRHHMYVLTCKLVWTNNPSMEKVNTGVRVIHLARLNPAWTFSAFSAFISLPEVKIISDVSTIRKASNRELEFNILPNWTPPPSVCGSLAQLWKIHQVSDHFFVAISLTSSPRQIT